jgi:heme exporter protein D
MIWQNAAEFWAMGGYGVYVWGSMGVSGALLALEVVLARGGRQQALEAVCEAIDADIESVAVPPLRTGPSAASGPTGVVS